MASKSRVIYVGVPKDLHVRVFQHKSGRHEGFTKRYNVNRLVYFESYKYVNSAIAREKELKGWRREKRVALIESVNPTWEDLAATWFAAEELTRDPNAPATMKLDPSKIRTFGDRRPGEFTFKRADPKQETVPKLRRRKVLPPPV